MDFALTPDQSDMSAALRDMLQAVCPPATVRAAWQPGIGPAAVSEILSHLAGIGALGVLAPEQYGGLGGNEIDLAVLMEECGRFCVPGPVTEHAAIGVPALAGADHPAAADAAAGATIVTALDPGRDRAAFTGLASFCVLPAEAAVTVPGEWLAGPEAQTVDRSQRSGPIQVRSHQRLPGFDRDTAADRATLSTAAQLAGLARRAIDMTAEYVRTRRQFGQPVGSQQAVKHMLATALIALEHARPVVYRAAYALANHEVGASRTVSFAKVYAYRAAHTAARTALQCHGAIGYTWEHDLHMWIKRIWSLGPAWGTVAYHEAQVADSLFSSDNLAPPASAGVTQGL